MSTNGAAIRVVLNGEERRVAAELTVSTLLADEGEPADHVLVEINGSYCPPRRHGATRLAEGDRVEIILPAFGG